MAEYYKIIFDCAVGGADLLRIGFGDPAQNDEICREVERKLGEAISSGILTGGPLIKVNGPASLPVAVVIAHAVSHLYKVVAVFDPKLGRYVVAVSHGTQLKVGDLID
jgi:CRISPR-associated protein Csx3